MTERTRVPSRQSVQAPLRFSPGDETKPPLIHVTITKEESPMAVHKRHYDPAFRAEACERLQAGESLKQVSRAMGVPVSTLASWQPRLTTIRREDRADARLREWLERSEQAASTNDPGEEGERRAEEQPVVPDGVDAIARTQEPAFRIELDPASANRALEQAMERWMAEHLRTRFDGTQIHVEVPPVPTRWVVQAQAIRMDPEEE